jgi:putative aldouronate transport system permease protein
VNKKELSQLKLVKYLKTIKGDWRLYTLLIPIIVWYLLWMYKPMAGLLIAFKNYKPNLGVMGSDWVGFTHFRSLVNGPYSVQFWRSFRSTFLISLYGLIFGFPIPIILALFFSEISNKIYRNVAQTFTYLPHFLSEVTITGLVLTLFYSGEVNTGVLASFIYKIGLVPEGVKVFQTADYFRPLFIITGMWKESGYSSIVYFASIMGISPVLYEAIKVSGGNKLQEVRYVTFPGMAPTLIIMIILRIGRMLSIGYERIILLYNENTYSTADVLSSFVFRIGLEQGNQALGASAGMFNALIAFALVMGANFISRQVSETSLW